VLNPVIRQLGENAARFRTHVCVGLDPDIKKLPDGFPPTVDGVGTFLREVIMASAGLCIAYKPNISFFEALGIPGLALLADLRAECPVGVPWIIDAKRGDIGNTSAMQARFLFDHLGADAVTLHPYMGEDSVAPFFDYKDKLSFVLALTSNPGAATFEKLNMASGATVWETVVSQCVKWHDQWGNLGLVVGGTQGELRDVRAVAGRLPFLIPGVGAQGAAYSDVQSVAAVDGHVAVINMSRSVLYCDSTHHFAQSIRNELGKFTAI
jgi:orotidine-5'-phosphate decarboxylase